MQHFWLAGFLVTLGAACSGQKDAGFMGTTRKLLSPPRVASDSSRLEAPPAATPPPMPDIAVETPPPAIVPTPPPALEAIVVNPEALSSTGQGVTLGWRLSQSAVGLQTFHIRILDAQDNVVFEKVVDATSTDAGATFSVPVDITLPEGDLRAEVWGVSVDGASIRGTAGRILVDKAPPVSRLYLGAEHSANACSVPPGERDWVSTRVITYEFCATDASGSGVEKVCVKNAAEAGSHPSASDTCWVDPESAARQLLLSSADGGKNRFVLFSRDKVGNVGADEPRLVTLVKTTPPRVDILKPTAKEISSAPWVAGQQVDLKWEITDNDTPYEDIRVVVTLIQAEDHTKFRHLACNFANTKVFKQCPEASLERSSLITADGSNRGTFRFKVPTDWDSTIRYTLVVTAIDKAGNAAVASTQEINAPWELLAGRTYKGLGGSGVTLERAQLSSQIATDKLGQLFDISSNLKLNAFDLRSCRFTRKTSEAPGPFDCADILVTDFAILNRPWVYLPGEDVFQTITNRGGKYELLELDFKAGSVRSVLGGGDTALGRDLPAGSAAAQLSIPVDGQRVDIFHDTVGKRTYLLAAGMLFHVSGARGQEKVSYVMGNGWELAPADQMNLPQRDIKFPLGLHAFAVAKDNRILMSGSLPDNWRKGGSLGVQYLMRSFSLSNPTAAASLEVLPPLTARADGVVDPKAADPVGVESSFIRALDYRPEANEFFASLAWIGYYSMPIPAADASRTSYRWTLQDAVKHTWSGDVARIPGTPVFYLNDCFDGKIWIYDHSDKSQSLAVGFGVGSEGDGLGQNRYLDMPVHVQAVSDSEVWFNDFYNLQSVGLTDAWRINTRVLNFDPFPFRVTATNIIQYGLPGSRSGWWIYPRSGGDGASFKLATNRNGYDVQYALSNDLRSPKAFAVESYWDSVKGYVYDGSLYFSEATVSGNAVTAATSQRINPVGTLDATRCGTSGTEACLQGVEKLTVAGDTLASPGVRYFDGAEFRLTQMAGHYVWHSNVSTVAFDSSDRFVFTCFFDRGNTGRFMLLDSQSNRLYPFAAKVAGSSDIAPCNRNNPHFLFMNIGGQIYLETSSNFYKLKSDTARTNNQMEFELLPVSSAVRKGSMGGFWITNDYLYYTDKVNNRVFRNRR